MYTFPFVPFRYSKTLTTGVLILVLCLLPSSGFSKISVPITFMDFIVHFSMFFVFSAALYFDITKKRAKNFNRFSAILIAIAISIGLGILTELLQYFILPLGRSGSMGDLISDLLGSVAGASIAALIKRKSFAES